MHRDPDSLYSRLLAEWDAATILDYLTQAGGNIAKCADALGISRRLVEYKVQAYGLDAELRRLREGAKPVAQVRTPNPAEVADGAKPVAQPGKAGAR